MIKNDILNMPAGREMDALVAKRVMGWKQSDDFWWIDRGCSVSYGQLRELIIDFSAFKPSTDISSAWKVVESDIFDHFTVDRTDDRIAKWNANCYCVTMKHGNSVFADTACLAICRVALLATLENEI